jgi:hypothetical protein
MCQHACTNRARNLWQHCYSSRAAVATVQASNTAGRTSARLLLHKSSVVELWFFKASLLRMSFCHARDGPKPLQEHIPVMGSTKSSVDRTCTALRPAFAAGAVAGLNASRLLHGQALRACCCGCNCFIALACQCKGKRPDSRVTGYHNHLSNYRRVRELQAASQPRPCMSSQPDCGSGV